MHFAQGVRGYCAEQADDILYVGFKFSGLFGIFETGDLAERLDYNIILRRLLFEENNQ